MKLSSPVRVDTNKQSPPWQGTRGDSAIPLVDLVAHAKRRYGRPVKASDVVTTITIYGAAVLATAGFVIASVVDVVLRPDAKGSAH